ncbi:MAG: NTP transferase domain-containing protein [Planctomycetaceae bacterium]|nr:NTP transferase domain-containing protein [Planctomycetaceae bacterium]
MERIAIILAAGQSTRMNTRLPKVLHEVCGRPMLEWVIEACRNAGVTRHLVVVGYGKEQITALYQGTPDVEFVEQPQQRGTGHAVMCCRPKLTGFDGQTLVLCGDAPLIRTETLKMLIQKHEEENSAVTLATANMPDPKGYGRIVRDGYGNIQGIVEHNDCDEKQRLITEINPGYFCFQTPLLLEALDKITPNNVKNEYYLTDALHILLREGHKATAVTAVAAEDAMGVNNRQQLATVGKIMQQRIQDRLMKAGVTIVDPPNTWIDARAQIGQDTVIQPFTCITGAVRIGCGCRVGPFAYLYNGADVPDGAVVGVFETVRNNMGGTPMPQKDTGKSFCAKAAQDKTPVIRKKKD